MLRSIAYVLPLLIAVSNLAQADYCNIKTCAQKNQHTMCKYPTESPGPACQKVIRVGLTPAEVNGILKYHNDQRQLVARGGEKRGNPGPQPAAKAMPMLTWDPELARVAQRWASQCVFAHDPCRDVDAYAVGQNIGYWGTTGALSELNVLNVIQAWYEEVKFFDSREVAKLKGPGPGKPDVGHYTQLVWAKSTRVGCGSIVHTNGSFTDVFSVCNYGPSGNWIGEPMYEIRV